MKTKNNEWDIMSLEDTPTVYIPHFLPSFAQVLDREMDGLEWGAFLVGEGNRVEDVQVPEQTVTTVYWKAEVPPPENTIGTIHSHHSMGSDFHSQTDRGSLGINYPIMLITGRGGIKAWVRIEWHGQYLLLKAQTETITPDEQRLKIQESLGKIKEEPKPEKNYNRGKQRKNYGPHLCGNNQQIDWGEREGLQE